MERWPNYRVMPANGDGVGFERYVGTLLMDGGYHVQPTPQTNDYGADLILTAPDGMRIAVQCKYYASPINNSAVQEVIGSLNLYQATTGWVVTNSTFTSNAIALAQANGIRLIDGEGLVKTVKVIDPGFPFDHIGNGPDFSGLDIMATPLPQYPALYQAASVPQPVVDEQPETFNLSEVAQRWGCSTEYVKKQIPLGLPLVKLPNGRWSITKIDLVAWERNQQQLQETMRQRAKLKAIISLLATLILIVVGLLALLYLFPGLGAFVSKMIAAFTNPAA